MNRSGVEGAGRTALYAVSSLLISAAALLPTLKNGFTTWDDPLYILENPFARSLCADNVAAIFTTASYAGNYHPLTLLFTAMEYSVFGSSPFGYHLVSLLLHLGVVFLVFDFVRRLTASEVTAFGVALLFGIHPLHLEPVAWLADQKDLLYSLFYLGALSAYLRTRDEEGTKGFVLATVPLFLLSLLSKGLAVTLPVTLLLVELFLEGRITPLRRRRIIPLFALSILFGILAINAQRASGAISSLPSETLFDTMLYASAGYVTYLVKLLVPFGLSPYYPYPAEVPGYYWALALVAVGVVGLALFYRKKSPIIFFGVAFFTVSILPVLQFMQVGNAMMADRYAYLPSIGILLIVVRRMETAARTLKTKYPGGRIPAGIPAGIMGGIYALSLAAMTFSLGPVWRDGASVWDRVIREYPDHPKGYFNRGTARHTLGDERGAVADYDMTLRLAPDYPYGRFNRGISLFLLGEHRRAMADFNSAAQTYPDETLIFHWRGNLFASVSEFDLAIADYTRVLDINPGDFGVLMRRAAALTNAKRYEEAIADYSTGLTLKPSDVNLYLLRGNLLSAMGRYDQAIGDYSTVLRSTPTDRDALYSRAIAYHLQKKQEEACADLRQASALGSSVADQAMNEVCGR